MGLALLLSLVMVSGCAVDYTIIRTDQSWVALGHGIPINKMAVLPLETTREADLLKEVPSLMTDLVVEAFSMHQEWGFTPWKQITEALRNVEGKYLRERARSLGWQVRAHAVLFGRIKRFHERVGNEKEVKKPASVAFDVQLLDVNSGDLLWWATYNETQKEPRGDDLLMPSVFISKPRWLTARELASQAIRWLAWDLSYCVRAAFSLRSGRRNGGAR